MIDRDSCQELSREHKSDIGSLSRRLDMSCDKLYNSIQL